MNTSTRGHTASRLGRSFGRGWRACARCEQRVVEWLVAKGVPAAGATALVWVVKLAVLGVLLYFALWLALALLFVVAVAWYTTVDAQDWGGETDFLNRDAEERDHREGLFYHPASYNDDPDPRFEGD